MRAEPGAATGVRVEEIAVPDEFTEGQTPPAGAAAAAPSVTPSTGRAAASTGAWVSVVLVVRNDSSTLAACLDGLAGQTVVPDRLLVVDVGSTDTSGAIVQAHARVRHVVPDLHVLQLQAGVPIGQAVDLGIAALPPPRRHVEDFVEWVWVLQGDSVPHPTALARLLGGLRSSPSAGIAGPKIVERDDPRRLVGMGIQVTRTGRLLASPAPGEADQGQHDSRTDVLAVNIDGMLLRRDVHRDLGGFDASFQDAGAELDLGWRAQLAGHRVIVVPGATLLQASAEGVRPGSSRSGPPDGRVRRAARQVALARCSLWAAPFMALWMALAAIASAVVLLAAKRPKLAWRELGDVRALLRPAKVVGARWRGRHATRLRRGHLRTLFVSPAAAARSTLDHLQDAVAPAGSRRPREVAHTSETGPTADDSESLGALPPSLPQRVATHPGALAVAAMLVATGFAWRDAIRAGALAPGRTGLAGGQLRPVATDSSGLWHAFRDAWHGAGLGSGGESGPHLAVMSALTWLAELAPGLSGSRSSVGVTVAWLLFLAPVLSVWTAYLAGRVVSRSRVARAIVALVWGGSAVLTTAIMDGRVTAALGHVLLPLVLAGFCLAARRHGTYTATFATALATAVLVALVPPLLVVSTCAALALLVLGPGQRRLRALVLLVVPPALLGPWLAAVLEDWRLLLSGPGLVSTAAGQDPLQTLLLRPDAVAATSGAAPSAAAAAASAPAGLLLLTAAPVVLLGLLGYSVRTRGRSETVGLAMGGLLAVVGLAVAVGSPRVELGSAETGVGLSATAHLWSGIGVELWLAGLLVGMLAGSRFVLASLRPRAQRAQRPQRPQRPQRAHLAGRGEWRTLAAGAAVALVAASAAAGLGTWATTGTGTTLTVTEATLPAVAIEQSGDPLSNRLLLLRPQAEVVDFVLSGREPGELLRDLDRPTSADDRPLVEAVARLVGGSTADSLDASELAGWGVGFVQVRAASGDALVRRLDATRGLSRLGAGEHGILWKVLPSRIGPGANVAAPSRVRLVDEGGGIEATVPTVGPHAAADTRVPPSSTPRRLVVAEPPEWAAHAVVSLDGRSLAPVSGGAQPIYDVPAAGGWLRIDLAAAQPWWRLAQAVLLGFVAFMALPFGNRRSRRSQP